MIVYVTGFYAGFLAIMLVVLTKRVVGLRYAKKIGIDTGADKEMIQAVRVHGNFTEYVPIILILMGILELNGTPSIYLHVMGIVLVISRISHAIGLSRTIRGGKLRVYGMFATIMMLVAGGGASMVLSILHNLS